jgi:cytochrome P450
MEPSLKPLPTVDKSNAQPILKALATQRSLLAGMEAMHRELGDIFEITMPGFKPVVLSGPSAARELLVENRDQFKWRVENDPVTRLLRHGVLVEDGDSHDRLRSYMQPALKRSEIERYLPEMLACTDSVISSWEDGSTKDMLVEMRKLALMILMQTLFSVDIRPDLERLWEPILRVLKFISPGLWIVKPDMPRPGYQTAIDTIDDYLYAIIRQRRTEESGNEDMLSDLLSRDDMDDDLVRDQMLTMLIAGHDTSTALLSWVLYLLSEHPQVMNAVQQEVDQVLLGEALDVNSIGRMHYLEQVIKETLRLYPPIHAANRVAGSDTRLHGCPVGKGQRVMFSYYLTHRDTKTWEDPEHFDPERFARDRSRKPIPLSYLPFGGGPRNCIGAAFAQSEAKIILARILQQINLEPVGNKIKTHMGATLEPKPGVRLRVSRRLKNRPSEPIESLTSSSKVDHQR